MSGMHEDAPQWIGTTKRSTRCPSCQTLLNFPASLKKQITCPRPWCKTQFNPFDEPNWPANQVAPPPRGKDQQFCYRCETLCNFTQGVDYFICPKCRATTIVNHASLIRKALFLALLSLALLAGAAVLLVGVLVLGWSGLAFVAAAGVLCALGLGTGVGAVSLYRHTKHQKRRLAVLSERTRLIAHMPQP